MPKKAKPKTTPRRKSTATSSSKSAKKSTTKSTIKSTTKSTTKSTKKPAPKTTSTSASRSAKTSSIKSTKKPAIKSTKRSASSPKQKTAPKRKAKDIDLRQLYQDLAENLGGTYKPPNLTDRQYPQVEVTTGKWTITYEMGDLRGVKTTNISAPYKYAKTILFMICKGGDCFDSDRDNPDVSSGDPKFDAEFKIDAADPLLFKQLFADKSLCLRLRSFSRLRAEMHKDLGESEIFFCDFSHVTDMGALVEFHDLLVILLNRTYQLCYPDQKLASRKN